MSDSVSYISWSRTNPRWPIASGSITEGVAQAARNEGERVTEADLMERQQPCFVCGRMLAPVVPAYPPFQADDGAMCLLVGNYGSTVHDSLVCPPRRFWVCDPCLVERFERTTRATP